MSKEGGAAEHEEDVHRNCRVREQLPALERGQVHEDWQQTDVQRARNSPSVTVAGGGCVCI